MDWNPDHYLRFGDERLRPGLDLMNRIALEGVNSIVDLGCGTGTLTQALSQRWPEAGIVAIDRSAGMMDRVVRENPKIEWRMGDIQTWYTEQPLDLIYSNAALHWINDHPALFSNLLAQVAPGGALAVQVPNNFDAQSHRVLRDLAESPRWSALFADQMNWPAVLPMKDYLELLAPKAARVDFWETTYYHILSGADPVLEWVRSTVLRPLLAALPGDDARVQFEADCGAALKRAYPTLSSGVTPFAFKRLFLIVYK